MAERRIVTVLFADLVGFTAYAEKLDPEAVRETLSRYFEAARTVVERYDGTVEKFIGDAVMAVWGAPQAHEDDAERAVRAGLDMIAAIGQLGRGIEGRGGITTGEAAVNIGAVGEGIVAGDLVNTASRLQAVAAPGAVLVDEQTRRAAARRIAFDPGGELTLRGKSTPVRTWCAIRAIADQESRETRRELEPSFIGRERELRLLDDLLDVSATQRRIHLLSIVGPAGIGKTRLVAEFEKRMVEADRPVLWHHGRSPAYGERISLRALSEMVRRRLNIADEDEESTKRVKLANGVRAYVADADREWAESSLQVLLGLDNDDVQPDELFAGWRAFIEGMCLTAPVVLVFEDVHLADQGTFDFIDHLLEWSRRQPLLVVTLARPELFDRRPDWGAAQRDFTSLDLEPLSSAAIAELLRGMVPGLPDHAVTAIVDRSDGVPLYAVEMIRALVANGTIRPSADGYEPAGDLANVVVPDNLAALIEARLDALAATDHSLIKDAAVLGVTFSIDALAAVSGLSADALPARLRGLVRAEIVVPGPLPATAGRRAQYAFVQSLIREVAYRTLARRDRVSRHVAAARYYESSGGDDAPALVASHYMAASRSAPEGEGDDLRAQACEWLCSAAERAVGLGSHDQAIALLTEALATVTSAAERAALLARAGQSASAAGHDEQAETLLRQALDVRVEVGDRKAIALAVADLASALISCYRLEAAETVLDKWHEQLSDLTGTDEMLAVDSQLARVAYVATDCRRAATITDAVLELAEHRGLTTLVVDTLVTRGSALCGIGRLHEGMGVLLAAESLARRYGLNAPLVRAIGNRAVIVADDDPREALDVARRQLQLERRLGRRHPQVYATLTDAAFRTGDWDAVISELEQQLPDARDAGFRTALLSALVAFRAVRGEPYGALMLELEQLVGAATEPFRRLELVHAQFMANLAANRLDDARSQARWIAAVVKDIVSVQALEGHAAAWSRDAAGVRDALASLEAVALRGQATDADRLTMEASLAALEGDRTTALEQFAAACTIWRKLGLKCDEALLGIDVAETIGPGEARARPMIDAARELLAELRATPFVDRLDRALAAWEHGQAETRSLAAPAISM